MKLGSPSTLVLASLLGCATTVDAQSTPIERPSVRRTLRDGSLLGGAELIEVRRGADGRGEVRVGSASHAVDRLIGVGVGPTGAVWIVRRGDVFAEAQELGSDRTVSWILPADGLAVIEVGATAAWVLDRAGRQVTAHPLGDGPKRLASHPVAPDVADVTIGPDDTLWVADPDGRIRALPTSGEARTIGGPAERARTIGGPAERARDVARITAPVERLAFAHGLLWVLCVDGALFTVDPAGGEPVARGRLPGAGAGLLAHGDALFALSAPDMKHVRAHGLDASGGVRWSSADLADRGREMAVVGPELVIGAPGAVLRLDLASGTPR